MPPLTHAGGVVRRETPEGTRLLLVRASRAPFDWVLPKGHIEPGEAPEQTARREVREEAGVDAEIVRSLGDLAYETRGEPVHVRYFAMDYRRDVPPTEARETRWCSLEECERLLAFASSRDIVRRAATRSEHPRTANPEPRTPNPEPNIEHEPGTQHPEPGTRVTTSTPPPSDTP